MELAQSHSVRVILALGAIAHAAVLRAFGLPNGAHRFAHAAEYPLSGDRMLLDSYHCSRYNTQTRRLTTPMFEGRGGQGARPRVRRAAGMNQERDAAAPAAAFDAKSFVDSLPARPGVYRMLDAQGEILYVGKARNLKSRVGSYFQPSNVHPKVQALVAKTAGMEVTITNSDTEALLLEFNLIKKHRPRFNVVLRDDKTFPYLHFETRARISATEFLPRLAQGTRAVLRALSVGGRGARNLAAAAEALSPAKLRRHVFCESIAPLPAVPDPALHGALRRAHFQGELRARRGRGDQGAGGAQR